MDTEIRRLLKIGGMLHQDGVHQFGRIEHDNGARPKMKNTYIAALAAHTQQKIKPIEAKV